MCQLFGINANAPTDITFSLSGLIPRGGKTGPHRDGWGIAFYEEKACRLFLDPTPCAHSKLAEFIKSYSIKSTIVISHIRRANRGKVCLANTHPFTRELWGKNWTFAHNGQLKEIKKLPLTRFQTIGTTDSEHAFCWLMNQIFEKYGDVPPKLSNKYYKFIYECCLKLSSYGAFNCLLSDSIHLFAFCSTKLSWITRKAPFGYAQLKDEDLKINFNGKNSEDDIMSVIATEPLTNNEVWLKMERHEFHVFKDGLSLIQFKDPASK